MLSAVFSCSAPWKYWAEETDLTPDCDYEKKKYGNTNLKKLEKDMGTQVKKVRKENGNKSENLVRFATKRCP